MLTGPRSLKLALRRSDVRYTRAAEAHFACVEHCVLSRNQRLLRFFHFDCQAVVGGKQQVAVYRRSAVLETERAVIWNARLKAGRTSVDPVWLTGGEVAGIEHRMISARYLAYIRTHAYSDARTHEHTHTHPFTGPLSGTTQVSQYQKG